VRVVPTPLVDTLAATVSELRGLVAAERRERAVVLAVRDHAVVATAAVGHSASHSVSVQPAAVLSPVLANGADSLLLVHTHVADDPPSLADHAVTRRLVAAAAVVGVAFLGHLVVTPAECFVVTGSRRS
jgi:DNA repair protein RadC